MVLLKVSEERLPNWGAIGRLDLQPYALNMHTPFFIFLVSFYCKRDLLGATQGGRRSGGGGGVKSCDDGWLHTIQQRAAVPKSDLQILVFFFFLVFIQRG